MINSLMWMCHYKRNICPSSRKAPLIKHWGALLINSFFPSLNTCFNDVSEHFICERTRIAVSRRIVCDCRYLILASMATLVSNGRKLPCHSDTFALNTNIPKLSSWHPELIKNDILYIWNVFCVPDADGWLLLFLCMLSSNSFTP